MVGQEAKEIKLYELGFNADRFDRVSDYTQQIAMVPCSAKTKDGLAELLMLISGLSQKFLENSLKTDVKGPGKGIILEVKEEKGLGTTLDVIVYDGTINKNDQIIIGTFDEPIITKVKAIFEPEKGKLKSLSKITASSGVKLTAIGIENAISGMPLKVITNLEEDIESVKEEISEILVEIDNEGITIKADSLGSLEALIKLLKENNLKIKKASIGNISKKDISEVSAELNPLDKVIIGFNVKNEETKEIKIITSNVIYTIIDEVKKWQEEEQKKIEAKELENVTRPCKLKFLPDCTFRESNPAVIGIEVLNGTLKIGMPLFKDSKELAKVKSMQLEKENIKEIPAGKQGAISLPGLTAGRQINENDILYSFLTEAEFRRLKELKKFLNNDEIEALKEIAVINRKINSLWGI
ncbi:MAG: EF-Tu/IF-2/RF-3 family GTPase [Candidatus Nanoarchaeia archaeon]|nr:EF-Tu/IF-2/RF-3 family GTPase [Candidatus Nanoarchaeia archaeon]